MKHLTRNNGKELISCLPSYLALNLTELLTNYHLRHRVDYLPKVLSQ
jgi:hypothetical protein